MTPQSGVERFFIVAATVDSRRASPYLPL